MNKKKAQKAAREFGRAMATANHYDLMTGLVEGLAEMAEDRPNFLNEDLRHKLSALNSLEKVAEQLIWEVVQDSRDANRSWDWIADALEVSRQAAWRKYRATGEGEPEAD